MWPKRANGQMNKEKDHEDSHGVVPPPPPPGPRIEELFLQQHPPVLHDVGDPIEAKNWVRALEHTFDLLRYTDRERMTCMPFQLAGPADFWWKERKKVMTPVQRENLTWEQFKVLIYEKYIDPKHHKGKQAKSYHPEQDQKSVIGCNWGNCDIPKNTPDQFNTKGEMVETFNASLRHVAEDFCAGLKHEIMMTFASNRGLTLPNSLDRAQDMETAIYGKRHTPTPAQDIEKLIAHKQRFTPWPCPKCHKEHDGNCLVGTDICFFCHKSGHFISECPNKPSNEWAGPKQTVQFLQLGAEQAQPHVHGVPTRPLQQLNFREKRKWDCDQTPHEHKKQHTVQNHLQGDGRKVTSNRIGGYRPKVPPCVKCSKAHQGECKAGTDKCYNCGKSGHWVRECLDKNAGMGARQNSQRPRPPLQVSQVEPSGNLTLLFPLQQQCQSNIQQAGAYALQPEGEPM